MAKETFTDNKRVKDLIRLMADNDLTEIELVEDKAKIRLKRDLAPDGDGTAPPPATPSAIRPAAAATAPAQDENLVPVKSPMVGTFYSAANPESDPYVKIGAPVEKDTIVCIIEAMKVFNEIRAETTGAIVKILVQNGQAVEYNQPLFLVKPE